MKARRRSPQKVHRKARIVRNRVNIAGVVHATMFQSFWPRCYLYAFPDYLGQGLVPVDPCLPVTCLWCAALDPS